MKVLLIDDNEDYAKPLRRMIEIAGTFNGSTLVDSWLALGGRDGYRETMQIKPDLVLLDIMMPDYDGIEILRQLRTDGFEKPIVMNTAICDPQVAEYAKQMGANDYIIKGRMDLTAIRSLLSQYVPTDDPLAVELTRQQEQPICPPSLQPILL